MKIIIRFFYSIIVMIIITNTCSKAQNKTQVEKNSISIANKSMSSSAVNLKAAIRLLWEEHVTRTRNVIICLVDDAPGTEKAIAMLLKNQEDIGNALKPYYGEAEAKKIIDLLNQHIKTFVEVVKAAKVENTVALNDANKRWYDNADEIAKFFNKVNTNWKLADMKLMMHTHLKLTTDEAVARIKKDYNADAKAYDAVHIEILKMADMISEGIGMQFPEKNKNNSTAEM